MKPQDKLVILVPLLFGGFFLVSPAEGVPPGGTVVYYVTPTAPPNPDCPATGEPCQTLDYYVTHTGEYFGIMANATMLFLRGNHTVRDNSTNFKINSVIQFAMAGMYPAQEVVICVNISFNNVFEVHIEFENITYAPTTRCHHPTISVLSVSQTSLSVVNSYLKSSTLYLQQHSMYSVATSDIVLAHSIFSDGATVRLWRKSYPDEKGQNTIKLTHCLFLNGVSLDISYQASSIVLEDCCIDIAHADSRIEVGNSTVLMSGNTSFSTAPQVLASHCNVTLSGNISFTNSQTTAFTAYSSTITLSGTVSFVNNTGTNGGALALYSSTLNIARNTSVYFYNNSALETGGAIYVYGQNMKPSPFGDQYEYCFYHLMDYMHEDDDDNNTYKLQFEENHAKKAGEHLFGVRLLGFCTAAYNIDNATDKMIVRQSYNVLHFFTLEPGFKNSISAVSSEVTRVCICDDEHRPQCADNISNIFPEISAHPGETFTLPVVVVGGDFGTSTGTVYAGFMPSTNSHAPSLKPEHQFAQTIINSKLCTDMNYTLYSNQTKEQLYLTVEETSQDEAMAYYNKKKDLQGDIVQYHSNERVNAELLFTPVFITVTLQSCPPGFTLLGDPPGCDCYPALTEREVKCDFINGTGYISWNGPMWVNMNTNFTDQIVIAQYCPSEHCQTGDKMVSLQDDPDAQCVFNHAGRLCGGCKENYSLALGSSHCIYCPNNNYLALLIWFAAAGVLLVFVIAAFNLTVTEGMINGLIFYANIVWAYRGIVFPQPTETNVVQSFLKLFVAWINLDFGIQTCFFDGLTAFWKTWLQFVFPIYTAGLFIIGLRNSKVLARLFGDRSVPVLSTLLFLSYTKLLHTITTAITFQELTSYPSGETQHVWAVDGRLEYGHYPHITVMLAALACLLLLWMPYTLLLLVMQWLRKTPNSMLSRWITRYKPVFDAYYAPLKDKHHYWFGVLLLVRGILLLVFSSTANVNPAISLFLLLGLTILLLCYMNYQHVYKSKSVMILESSFLINLILLVGVVLYYSTEEGGSVYKMLAVCASMAVVFIEFCGIALWSLLQICFRCRKQNGTLGENVGQGRNEQQQNQVIEESDQYRDSILTNTPLIQDKD